DSTGRVIWRKNILDDTGATNIQWGMSTSPLVFDRKVVVQPGATGGRSVVAYDVDTGERVWSALDDRTSYASPMHVTLAGVPQILVTTASRLVSLAPDSGTLLWETPWVTPYDINAAQPVVISANRVFYSSGSGVGAAVFEFSVADGRWRVQEVWRNIRMKNQFSSSVLVDGHLYGLDENILACVDAASGQPKWKGGRYGYGQLIRAGDRLIVQTEDGDLVLVRATPTGHQELGKFSAIPGKSWNVPSLADGILIVRNTTEMAAFDVK
ncbi:MAG TPA: PQQ-binding-like beta-propeller repeat protein, partial [Vicinamibacterales bacterium]|nr:PQQ-binding-like beta-propeller repeat protein [Vicinamibacterales bacterium]